MDNLLAAAILTGSITGAGLTVAIYALIIPISGRIIRDEVESRKRDIEELKTRTKSIDTDKSLGEEEFERLSELLKNIEEREDLPSSFTNLKIPFYLYLITATLSLMWFYNISHILFSDVHPSFLNIVVPWLFLISTVSFLLIGKEVIGKLKQLLDSEFKEIKRSLKDDVEEAKKVEPSPTLNISFSNGEDNIKLPTGKGVELDIKYINFGEITAEDVAFLLFFPPEITIEKTVMHKTPQLEESSYPNYLLLSSKLKDLLPGAMITKTINVKIEKGYKDKLIIPFQTICKSYPVTRGELYIYPQD